MSGGFFRNNNNIASRFFFFFSLLNNCLGARILLSRARATQARTPYELIITHHVMTFI